MQSGGGSYILPSGGVQRFPNKVDNKWVHNKLVSALQLLAKRVLMFFVRRRQFFF